MSAQDLDQISLQYAAGTDTGRKRQHNEDCYAVAPDIGLWLVADGVGGHSCGEVASDIVRNNILEQVAAGLTLEAAVLRSHEAVLAHSQQDAATSGMGSTVVALMLQDRDYEIAWVGDSRAYLFATDLTQITLDHSRVNELIAKHLISKEQAVGHPQRHVLTQSLGISPEMELSPGSVRGSLQPGEQILLCSDGLTDELSDHDIADLMAANETPRAQVDALILGALERGGADNVTVVAVGDYASKTQSAAFKGKDSQADLETTQDWLQTGNAQPSHSTGFPFKVLIALIGVAGLAFWLL